jgi:transposase
MAAKQRTTAREWAARVKRWQRSGLSAPEFGRREGFKGEQLTWWKWHLSGRSKKAAPPKRKRSTRKPKRGRAKAARFVPVKLPATVSRAGLEIVLGNGRVVRVPSDCRPRCACTWLRPPSIFENRSTASPLP